MTLGLEEIIFTDPAWWLKYFVTSMSGMMTAFTGKKAMIQLVHLEIA